MTKKEVLSMVSENNIEMIRFVYIDNEGVIRSYISTAEALEGDLDSGHPFAIAMPFFSVLDDLTPETRFGCVDLLLQSGQLAAKRLQSRQHRAVVKAGRSRGAWAGRTGEVRVLEGLRGRLKLLKHRDRRFEATAARLTLTLPEAAFDAPVESPTHRKELPHVQYT